MPLDYVGLARKCSDNHQIRRLLSLASVYDGMNPTEFAKVGGIDHQTLRDWMHRFNTQGPDGLTNKEGAGLDPEIDGVVHWRQIDHVRIIKERFGVACSDSAVANYQSKLSFFYILGRPQHPAQDPKIIDGFKKTSQERSLHMWRI
jgi:transposase